MCPRACLYCLYILCSLTQKANSRLWKQYSMQQVWGGARARIYISHCAHACHRIAAQARDAGGNKRLTGGEAFRVRIVQQQKLQQPGEDVLNQP